MNIAAPSSPGLRHPSEFRIRADRVRFLITLGPIFVALGLLWPWLTRLGLGRLSAISSSIATASPSTSPPTRAILFSVVLSLTLWLLGR